MRALLIAFLLLSPVVCTMAERNKLKPTDFEPLTSLPWEKPGATLEGVLDAIFREPNTSIRYPVLAEYLRTIPVAQLNRAFDLCIDLEGAQAPDKLVEFFLPIWAKRDPKACWKRTRELFHVVGIEDGWLAYDSWKERPRFEVQNLAAIRASRFWLTSEALLGFPHGVDESSLPKKERLKIMKEFADVWFAAFGSWPGTFSNGYSDRSYGLVKMLGYEVDPSITTRIGSGPEAEAAFEIALRRLLQANPHSAPEVIKQAQEKKWPPLEGQTELRSAGPSAELFVIWAKADLSGIIRWVESLDFTDDDLAIKAKAFLMSRVDETTRLRWLADATPEPREEDRTVELMDGWAAWDPKSALDAAVATNDAEVLEDVVSATVDGPWGLGAFNLWHFGLGAIKGFDVAKLPKETRDRMRSNWGQFVMEAWGEIDVGEAARYGLDFMLITDYAPPAGLIAFFSGKDVYPDEGGMIDRTFCALRVWAVVKPDEMKPWIATQKDAEMRKALTWLLEHPWGGPPASGGHLGR